MDPGTQPGPVRPRDGSSAPQSFLSFYELCADEPRLIAFLEKHNILKVNACCTVCKGPMYISTDRSSMVCQRSMNMKDLTPVTDMGDCSIVYRRTHNTFFAFTSTSLDVICAIIDIHLHTNPDQYKSLSKERHMRADSFTTWSHRISEVCYHWLHGNSKKLGGSGVIVEIDEMLVLNRRLKDRGQVTWTWMFGGFERGYENVFVTPVARAGLEELHRVINTWILPGTVVISDCWSAFNRWSENLSLEPIRSNVSFVNAESVGYEMLMDGMDETWKRRDRGFMHPERGEIPFNENLSVYLFKRRVAPKYRADVFFEYLGALYE